MSNFLWNSNKRTCRLTCCFVFKPHMLKCKWLQVSCLIGYDQNFVYVMLKRNEQMCDSKLTLPDSYLHWVTGRNREVWKRGLCHICFHVFIFYWFPKCLICRGVILFQTCLKGENYGALRLDKELRSHSQSFHKLQFPFSFHFTRIEKTH